MVKDVLEELPGSLSDLLEVGGVSSFIRVLLEEPSICLPDY